MWTISFCCSEFLSKSFNFESCSTCDAGMKRSRRRKGTPSRPASVITCPSMNVDHFPRQERPRNPKNFSSGGIVEIPIQPGCGMAPLGLDESSFEGCSSSVYTVRISLSDSMECTLYEADAAKDTPPTKPSRRGSR